MKRFINFIKNPSDVPEFIEELYPEPRRRTLPFWLDFAIILNIEIINSVYLHWKRLSVVRNVSEASEAWSPSEARSSDAERSRRSSAAGADEPPVSVDRWPFP